VAVGFPCSATGRGRDETLDLLAPNIHLGYSATLRSNRHRADRLAGPCWSLLGSWRRFLAHACGAVTGQTENAPGALPDGFDCRRGLLHFRNSNLFVHPEVSPQRNMHDRSPFALDLDDLLRQAFVRGFVHTLRPAARDADLLAGAFRPPGGVFWRARVAVSQEGKKRRHDSIQVSAIRRKLEPPVLNYGLRLDPDLRLLKLPAPYLTFAHMD
jgi:hypothetical protein